MVGVITRNVTVNEIANLKQVEVIRCLRFFDGTGEHTAFVVVANPLIKFPYFGKRSNFREIFFSE